MGGIFSPPSPAPAPTPVVEQPDPAAEERTRRLEEIDRRRRGRSGTVETGWRGVLSQSGSAQTGAKTKLGE